MNGQYEGDDPIGILVHDFNCKDPNEMRDDLMRERAKSLKESEKGVREVNPQSRHPIRFSEEASEN